MRRHDLRAATVGLGLLAPLLAQAEGPHLAAGYGPSAFEVRCDGGSCDRRDAGFRVAAGWRFATRWNVEFAWLDAGRHVASDVTADGTAFQGRTRVQGWGGTVGYALPVGDSLEIGLRAGVATIEARFSPGAAPAIGGRRSTTQFLGGATARWRFAPAWSLRLDWDHTRARMNRFVGDVDVATVGLEFAIQPR